MKKRIIVSAIVSAFATSIVLTVLLVLNSSEINMLYDVFGDNTVLIIVALTIASFALFFGFYFVFHKSLMKNLKQQGAVVAVVAKTVVKSAPGFICYVAKTVMDANTDMVARNESEKIHLQNGTELRPGPNASTYYDNYGGMWERNGDKFTKL